MLRGPSIWRRLLAPVACVAIIVAACGGAGTSGTSTPGPQPSGSGTAACATAPSPPGDQAGWTSAPAGATLYPVIVSSMFACGPNRVLFTFLDDQNAPVAKPDMQATISIFNRGRDGAKPTETEDTTFVWGIENERGFFVANVTFPEAGEWGAEFAVTTADGKTQRLRTTFQVQTSTPVVRVGQQAPASDTPTSASVGGELAKISSDDHPDPGFYKTSVKAALAAHEPFVVVFATPKFCVSAQCGPTLDRVKPLIAEHPTVDFIHVEPYKLTYEGGTLQPVLNGSDLVTNEWTNEWGLLSEPWVFVVNRDGIVTGSFEGVVATSELEAAIQAVT